MRNAKSAGDIRGTRLARRGQQIGDELDVVFEQGRRLRRASLTETTRLELQLRRELQCGLDFRLPFETSHLPVTESLELTAGLDYAPHARAFQ